MSERSERIIKLSAPALYLVAADGTRLLFLLNHRAEPVTVLAGADGVDLLTGARIGCGQPVTLGPRGVVVLREGLREGMVT